MSWKSLVTAGLLCVLASPVFAVRQTWASSRVALPASGQSRCSGNWVWNVQVTPDLSLVPRYHRYAGGCRAWLHVEFDSRRRRRPRQCAQCGSQPAERHAISIRSIRARSIFSSLADTDQRLAGCQLEQPSDRPAAQCPWCWQPRLVRAIRPTAASPALPIRSSPLWAA